MMIISLQHHLKDITMQIIALVYDSVVPLIMYTYALVTDFSFLFQDYSLNKANWQRTARGCFTPHFRALGLACLREMFRFIRVVHGIKSALVAYLCKVSINLASVTKDKQRTMDVGQKMATLAKLDNSSKLVPWSFMFTYNIDQGDTYVCQPYLNTLNKYV